FSAGIWLASAPLHEAGKTTKSGNTLKPGIRREELGFASDTLSSDSNACPLISTFSKPHSEVTSTTHIPALKEISKRRFAVFWFPQAGRSPDKCSVYKRSKKGSFSGKKGPLSHPAETHNKKRNFPPKDKTTLASRIL
ncbi:MAG TPA: hypothetical protein H9911_09090, partial [Candidatus Mediterraneibacter tabaqchaliae]|nr:hypothetical protein [Candidatus Mediterraneibacter tabaqchaliae]